MLLCSLIALHKNIIKYTIKAFSRNYIFNVFLRKVSSNKQDKLRLALQTP